MANSKQKFPTKLVIIGVIIVAIIGGAAYLMMGKSTVKNSMQEAGNSAFTSIRDALSKSVSLECNVVDENGNTTKAYIKNGAVRADMTSNNPNESGSMIMKDNTLYTWNGNEGVMMQLPEGDYEANAQVDEQATQGEDFINELEEYKDQCNPAVVSDGLFVPPTDVTFADMSEMMGGEMNEEELKKMMEMYSDQ